MAVNERNNPDSPGLDSEDKAQDFGRYRFASAYVADKCVLDMACGTGYGTYHLAGAGCANVIGVDVDEETVVQDRLKYQAPNLRFLSGNAECPPLPPNSFDVIVSFETIEHLPHPEIYLAAISKLVKADGTYLVSTPVRRKGRLTDKPLNPFHVREWNTSEFTELLGRYFGSVQWLGQSFHFQKSWVPGRRTLMRLLCRAVYPNEFSKLFRPEVTASPHLPGYFNCSAEYQIAVCHNPIKHGC